MLIIKVDPERPDEETVKKSARLFSEGMVAAIPTETFYALAANPFDKRAVERIYSLKTREKRKPLLMLVSEPGSVLEMGFELPRVFFLLSDRFWPGPLTLILQASRKVPEWVDCGTGTIGVRVSSNRIVSEILRVCRFPLTGTSANRSGCPPARSEEEVREYFREDLDFIVDGGRLSGEKASTVLDISSNEPVLLREGKIPKEELENVLRRKVRTEDRLEFHKEKGHLI